MRVHGSTTAHLDVNTLRQYLAGVGLADKYYITEINIGEENE